MPTRHYYLKIEEIREYSPVNPESKVGPPHLYKRDEMENPGHDNGVIPESEVTGRTLRALVYREYLDAHYLVPKPDRLVLADINEPVFDHRVPGALLYASPGDRLHIHVRNSDSLPHSFHVHGLQYGIDSDGSWPFGTKSADGRRSDEILPGQTWTYTFDVGLDMVGPWPFHDHYKDIGQGVNSGLFGGIIVLPDKELAGLPALVLPPMAQNVVNEAQATPARSDITTVTDQIDLDTLRLYLSEWAALPYVHPQIDSRSTLHVPMFLHRMQPTGAKPAFDGVLEAGGPDFSVVFGAAGTFSYHCNRHGQMTGTVMVMAGGDMEVTVAIRDTATMAFDPKDVMVAPGGKVIWKAGTTDDHTVTEDGGGILSWCFNGRCFAGNTPTIRAEAGQKIRWYIFNCDFSMTSHNFHTHAMRWTFSDRPVDVRSIGPAESFMFETVAPPPLRLPQGVLDIQAKPPKQARKYRLRGQFLFHCHVEMHMMEGLVGLVDSYQDVWLTDDQKAGLEQTAGLPLDANDPSTMDSQMSGGTDGSMMSMVPDRGRLDRLIAGNWRTVNENPQVTMMHAVLLPRTDKVLFWGYSTKNGAQMPKTSRVWDPALSPQFQEPTNQPHDVATNPGDIHTWDLHSCEQAFLDTPEGKILIHGGNAARAAFIFDPSTLRWAQAAPSNAGRYYSTSLTLGDGRVLTMFGADHEGTTVGTSRSLEIYDPANNTWSAPAAFPNPIPSPYPYRYYPWTFLLPGGDLFVSGHQQTTVRFNPLNLGAGQHTWQTNGGDRSVIRTSGERGTSVLLPLRPEEGYRCRILIAAGSGNHTDVHLSSEIIDLSETNPTWKYVKPLDPTHPHVSLNDPRVEQVNSVLLPDGRVFLGGGVDPSFNVGTGRAEIFDPSNPDAGWTAGGVMPSQRLYHSAALLLTDGSVLFGGDPNDHGNAGDRPGNPSKHDIYEPWYFQSPRPRITSAPPSTAYNASFTIQTAEAASIKEVVLIRPGSVTHGFNMSQRFVECIIASRTANTVVATSPPDGNIAPPGYYLLFIVTDQRVPSTAVWIRLH